MNVSIKAACIQLSVGPDPDQNLHQTKDLIYEAAGKGAKFIITPENTDFIETDTKRKFDLAASAREHKLIPVFAGLARELGVWLCIGSMKIKIEESQKLANRSHLFSPSGELKAVYDKIHLFDVDLPDGEVQRESTEVEGGNQAKIVQIQDNLCLGLSICYDVRFPHLFREMARNGADIITVPSAFTVSTGKAHWEVMLRARAIECGAYILAPAQGGEHPGSDGEIRRTYGHSMIINPWGEILGSLSHDEPGIIISELEKGKVDQARQAIQQLRHDRPYSMQSF